MNLNSDSHHPEVLKQKNWPPCLWDWRAGLVLLFVAGYGCCATTSLQIAALFALNRDAFSPGAAFTAPALVIPPYLIHGAVFGNALVALTAVWLVGVMWRRHTWAGMGLGPVNWGWVGIGALMGLGLAVLRIGLTLGLFALVMDPAQMLEVNELDVLTQALSPTDSIWIVLLAIFTISVVTPFYEEIFFRGFLYNWMRNKWSIWLAAPASAFIFGLIHLNPLQSVMAFVLGLGLAWLYEKGGSLWPAIAAHVVNNLLAQGLIYTAVFISSQLTR